MLKLKERPEEKLGDCDPPVAGPPLAPPADVPATRTPATVRMMTISPRRSGWWLGTDVWRKSAPENPELLIERANFSAPFIFARKNTPLLGMMPRSLYGAVVHLLSISARRLTPDSNSSQACPRHPKLTTYRCFLPDLTGFIGPRCVGPGYHRYLSRAVPAVPQPRAGIQPR